MIASLSAPACVAADAAAACLPHRRRGRRVVRPGADLLSQCGAALSRCLHQPAHGGVEGRRDRLLDLGEARAERVVHVGVVLGQVLERLLEEQRVHAHALHRPEQQRLERGVELGGGALRDGVHPLVAVPREREALGRVASLRAATATSLGLSTITHAPSPHDPPASTFLYW